MINDVPKSLLAGPWMTEHEVETVTKMLRDGWDGYYFVEEFERRFAQWHNRKYALMTPCCTHAIHLILLALNVGEGDEVIAPECTWTGSIAPITYTGAKPIFADIDPIRWCLTAKTIEEKITPRTKAIVVVDLYGNMPEMDAIAKLAEKHNIFLIEDSAEALGSEYKGVRAGKFGVGSVHSFHRTKTLVTGEGGCLLLDDDAIYERAKFLRDHGRSTENPYFVLEPAPKYMPSNFQASLAYAQFDRIEQLVCRKKEILHRYKKNLPRKVGVSLNFENEKTVNGAWATSLVIDEEMAHTGEGLGAFLAAKNIASRPFFYPMTSVPAYHEYQPLGQQQNPVSYSVSKRGITLPSHFLLTNEHIDLVSERILEFF